MSSSLNHESAAALRERMRGHLDAATAELRGCGEALRQELRPMNLVRKHPLASASMAGLAGLLVARLLFRRRAPAPVPAPPPPPPAATWSERLVTLALNHGMRVLVPMSLGFFSKRLFHSFRGGRGAGRGDDGAW